MRAPFLLILAFGCSGDDPQKQPEICRNTVDDDGDGAIDCTDSDCAFVCGEICGDGLDNDQDGAIDCDDEGCNGQCAEICDDGRDNDGDGFADCQDPEDCGSVCPESCDDDVDNDADALVDCDDPDCDSTCDGDGDTFVSVAVGGDDCDDANPDIHPGVDEVCDGVDNDCDALTDSADPELVGAQTFYNDDDDDGYGNPLSEIAACEVPPDAVDRAGDCDDADGSVHEGATEVCSGKDEDCDGYVDEDDPDLDQSTLIDWYVDGDGDGYGKLGAAVTQCTQPAGYADNNSDCDDTKPAVGPAQTWAFDGDGDGYGGGVPVGPQCTSPGGGWVPASLGLDCNDSNPAISPGDVDICGDGVDQDCDGQDFLGCYDTAALFSRYGGADVDEVAGTYDGTETFSYIGTPSGWVICEWTFTMLDWADDPTAVGPDPILTPCLDPDGYGCDWSYTIHGSNGHQTSGTDCAYYGWTAATPLVGPFGYGWTDDYHAGGTSFGPTQMYFFFYTYGAYGTPISNTWLGLTPTFSNATYDQGTGTLAYDWADFSVFPTP